MTAQDGKYNRARPVRVGERQAKSTCETHVRAETLRTWAGLKGTVGAVQLLLTKYMSMWLRVCDNHRN